MSGTSSGRALAYPVGAGLLIALPLIFLLTGCGPSYSPNIYSGNAVQQANKVDKGVIVGVRRVVITPDATVGTATGAAVGGIAGSQTSTGAGEALATLGGTLTGGLIGNVVGHKVVDTYGYEYIVQKPNGDLLSVTQKDNSPLRVGQHVLIIAGVQARIVSDYTVPDKVDTPRAPAAISPPALPKPDSPKSNIPKPPDIAPDAPSPPTSLPSTPEAASGSVPAAATPQATEKSEPPAAKEATAATPDGAKAPVAGDGKTPSKSQPAPSPASAP